MDKNESPMRVTWNKKLGSFTAVHGTEENQALILEEVTTAKYFHQEAAKD